MSSLKDVLIRELLDALDTIQEKVPTILEHCLDHDMDLDILTMHIISLRDTANLLAMDIEEAEVPNYQWVTPAMKQAALAMYFHINMLTDPESIYNIPDFGRWP